MEAGGHPDLIHIGRVLRERMNRTLEAEMLAARSAARRTRSIRDLLLAAEDAAARIHISATDALVHTGVVTGVGTDHVEITSEDSIHIVALDHVVTVEVDR